MSDCIITAAPADLGHDLRRARRRRSPGFALGATAAPKVGEAVTVP